MGVSVFSSVVFVTTKIEVFSGKGVNGDDWP
jgi:hypothetical protein